MQQSYHLAPAELAIALSLVCPRGSIPASSCANFSQDFLFETSCGFLRDSGIPAGPLESTDRALLAPLKGLIRESQIAYLSCFKLNTLNNEDTEYRGHLIMKALNNEYWVISGKRVDELAGDTKSIDQMESHVEMQARVNE